jgi:hypothetical protein
VIVEIIKNNQFTDKKGNILNNYKVFLNRKGTWISSLDFSSFPDLIEVGRNYVNAIVKKDGIIETESRLTDTITLKEPINDYYIINERQNQVGKFKVLLPKAKSILLEGVVNEPDTDLDTKELGVTNINGKFEIIDIPVMSMNAPNDTPRPKLGIIADVNRNGIYFNTTDNNVDTSGWNKVKKPSDQIQPKRVEKPAQAAVQQQAPQAPVQTAPSSQKGAFVAGLHYTINIEGVPVTFILTTSLNESNFKESIAIKPNDGVQQLVNKGVDLDKIIFDTVISNNRSYFLNKLERNNVATEKEYLVASKKETNKMIKQSEKSEKLNFVNNLLDYSVKKNVDSQTRERLFMLIGREVEKSGFNIEQIEAIVEEKLEQKLKKNNPSQPESHDPKNTVSVLSLFDTEFKYLTHEWDNEEIEFNRETYLKNIIFPIYDSSINANKKLPSHLKSRLWAFIKKPKIKNGEDNIWFVNPLFGKPFKSKYGWSSEAFIDWYDNSINKNIADTPMILDEMINPFKNSIQIRKGKLFDHLYPITHEILENKFEINYNKERLDSAKFYADVQDLFIAVKIILKNIKEEAETNDRYSVEFNYTEMDNFKILEIIHIDSKCMLNGTLNILGGNSNSIKEKLTGLCNWSIEAVFADGPKRLNILWDKQIAEIEDINYQPKGFVHKLYFY